MTPDFRCYVFACPNCHDLSRHGGNLGSCSVSTQRLWSDGWADQTSAPMRHVARFTKCPKCSQWYWLSDRNFIGAFAETDKYKAGDTGRSSNSFEWHWLKFPKNLKSIPWVNEPTPDLAQEALSEGFGRVGDDEKRLRLMIWRKRGDKYRQRADGLYEGLRHNEDDRRLEVEAACLEASERDDAWRSNAISLLSLLHEADDSERLLKAELLRQLGRFEEARILLEGLFQGAHSEMADGIRQLIDARDDALRVIVWPDPKYLVRRCE